MLIQEKAEHFQINMKSIERMGVSAVIEDKGLKKIVVNEDETNKKI